MNLLQTLALYGSGQTDMAALEGKPFRLVDQQSWGYGHVISEHDTYEEAQKAMFARPGSKILSHPDPAQQQKTRDKQRIASQKLNPDLDATSAAPVSPGSSLQPRNDQIDTPKVRDLIRRRRVRMNPDVD